MIYLWEIMEMPRRCDIISHNFFVLLRDSIRNEGLLIIFCGVLLVIAWEDLRTRKIRNRWTGLIFLLGLLSLGGSLVPGGSHAKRIPVWLLASCVKASGTFAAVSWQERIAGFFIISGPLMMAALLTHGGIGGGDIKLCGTAGLFLGWSAGLEGAVIGLFLNSLYVIVLLTARKIGRKAKVALGPFLAAGYFFVIFVSELP